MEFSVAVHVKYCISLNKTVNHISKRIGTGNQVKSSNLESGRSDILRLDILKLMLLKPRSHCHDCGPDCPRMCHD